MVNLDLSQKILQKLFFSVFTLILSLTVLIFPAQATGVYDLPPLNANSDTWVVDQAQTLSLSNENRLTTELSKLAQNTNFSLRMAVIRRLDYGETIDSFADQLFETWFPDPQPRANQLLLVMDTLTNQSTIRVGEKVKTVLSQEQVDSIISETMAYPLKESKYNQALLDSSDRLAAILSGKEDPGPPKIKKIKVEGTFTTAEETDDKSATIWVVGFLIVATIIPMLTYYWYVK